MILRARARAAHKDPFVTNVTRALNPPGFGGCLVQAEYGCGGCCPCCRSLLPLTDVLEDSYFSRPEAQGRNEGAGGRTLPPPLADVS